MPRTNPQVRNRVLLFFLIIFIIFVLLALRLVWIQVINSAEYQNLALNQRLREVKVEAKRGIIYDRNGKKLAVSSSSQTVVAIPPDVKNAKQTAIQLEKILTTDYQTIYDRITRNASAVYIQRKISDKMARQIKELDLSGIIFTEESKRYYPENSLASHLIGFAGIDSQGLDGIELAFDKYLSGKPGKITVERDAAGTTIPEGVREFVPSRDGFNIYLTIDEVIQYIAERELKRAEKELNLSGGSIIVMDPQNGDVLALANTPDYNPNQFADYPQKYWRNRSISDSFEPGSTFKIITTASALEEGVVQRNDIFYDPGYIKVSGERIDCWKTNGHGRQTFAEVVQNSCNPGFVQVGVRLGKDKFHNYIKAFGFGDETGIKLPGEAVGLVPPYEKVGPVELATFSFGHGLTVTPIQLISAVSAVANGGKLIRPRLVSEIRDADHNLIEKNEPVVIRQVVSESTASLTRELLEQVVADGTGANAAIPGYNIGGKTGTAQHYGEQKYDSSFIGMVPIDKPSLVVLVVLYDVEGPTYYGSQTAAPVFRRMTRDILRYLKITPENTPEVEEQKPETLVLPDFTGQEVSEVEKLLRNSNLNVKIVGSQTKILEQVPFSGTEVAENSTVILFTEKSAGFHDFYVAVPDFRDLTREDAIYLAQEIGLQVRTNGSGKVVGQTINPGERVSGGTEIILKLSNE